MAVLCTALFVIATGCTETTTTTSVGGFDASIVDAGLGARSGAWKESEVTGSRPAARAYHAMTYDSEIGKILLFGGTDADSGLDDTWAYDSETGAWIDLQPTGDLPSARDGHALVYDSDNRQAILFGGWDDRRSRDLGDTWIYDPGANTWTEIFPAGVKPAARDGHCMVYDPQGKKVILFGGVDTFGSFLNDTWAYDPATESWTEVDAKGAVPEVRAYSAMVYSPVEGTLILFGGGTEDVDYNDTWAYDPVAGVWMELQPVGDLPSKRSYHSMVYEGENTRVLLYGGGTDRAGYWDTWAYDPGANAWVDLDPPGGVPPVDRGHGMVYDPVEGTMILFGGSGLDEVSDATWIYDPSGEPGSFPDLFVEGPSPRGYHDLFYDSVGDHVVLFGGGTNIVDYGDTWAYDPDTNAWIDLTPYGDRPEARSWPALVYDPIGQKAFLFGGATVDRALNDIWTYDSVSNQWIELEAGGEPPPERWLPAAVYVSADSTLLLFGGGGVDGMLNDTWAYDQITGEWTARDPIGSLPSPRGYHSLAYDVGSGTVVLFGGMNDDNEDFGDTWSYDPASNSWAEIDTAGLAPSARSGHAMAYDSAGGKIILFGGATMVEGFNDTWVFDVGTGRWEEAKPTGNIPSERAYHAMAYDSLRERVILFGGFDGTQYVNDVWAYEPSSNTWTELLPMTGETIQARQDPGVLAASAKETGS